MKLYDNDRHRDTFTGLVYELLSGDQTCDRANQIIDSFDSAPAVELPDTTLGGTYVNIEWLKRTEAELKKYKELAAHPQGGPGDDSVEIIKPAEGDPHTYLKPCRICGNTEIVYERYRHRAGERWRCWCTKCLACIDPGWAQDWLAVRGIWNQSPPNDPLTLEELRDMMNVPVWIELLHVCGRVQLNPPYSPWQVTKQYESVDENDFGTYAIIREFCHYHYFDDEFNVEVVEFRELHAKALALKDYGKTWIAYRRRPEEAQT